MCRPATEARKCRSSLAIRCSSSDSVKTVPDTSNLCVEVRTSRIARLSRCNRSSMIVTLHLCSCKCDFIGSDIRTVSRISHIGSRIIQGTPLARTERFTGRRIERRVSSFVNITYRINAIDLHHSTRSHMLTILLSCTFGWVALFVG